MKEINPISLAVRLALLSSFVAMPTAFAAETASEKVAVKSAVKANTVAQNDDLLEEEEEVEKISITGSRIRREEFSSASPIQVISGDISRSMGVFNARDMLQSSSQAAGSQIDSSFGGFVLDNGPGATTIGFRGLGANRTLVLINGKRMVSAGVGGAPVAADLSLIPSIMIDQVENLFDGASTVYGSDAVAGVANVVLKKDIEGFQITAGLTKPNGSGGVETSLSAMFGKTFDQGMFSIGAEYYNEESRTLADNPFTSGCDEVLYETEDGRRLTENRSTGPVAGGYSNCDIFPLTNRVYFADTLWGSLYRTPGSSNTGIANFSETTVPMGWVGFHDDWYEGDSDGDGINDIGFVDGNGDGLRDVSFTDPYYSYRLSDYAKQAELTNKTERISLLFNGDYNFDDEANTRFYYEGLYAKRTSDSFSPGAQLFTVVGTDNPYNPCGEGQGAYCGGGLVDWGPSTAQPILNVRGDRDSADVDVSQWRAVAGVTGDLLAFDDFGAGGWFYDAYVTFAKSSGTNIRQGVHKERLALSLDTAVANPDGTVTCGNGSDGCVAVNLFADNLYQLGGGEFTQAEADYLFVDRVTKTHIDQTVFNGFISGDLYKLPWNDKTIATVVGVEYRRDGISTDANDVATEGLLQGWFADKGAEGDRSFREAFVEFDIPLIRGEKFAEELSFTASARITDESFYDAQSTYSVKAVYRPVDWFTVRGTRGTSYRAPNLRERFILGTSGFNTLYDPCVVPELARQPIDPSDINSGEMYDASNDTREQYTLDSCTNNGINPTELGIGDGDDDFLSTYSVEAETNGTENLDPETSLSKTWGFIFEQPFSEEFDLTLSVTKFDIEIDNSISEPGAAYVVAQCYNNRLVPDGSSGFCDKIDRDADSGRLDLVYPGFINIGYESSKGLDYNVYYKQEFLVGSENLELTVDLQATQMKENRYDVLETSVDYVGRVQVPEWRGRAYMQLKYNDFAFMWTTKFIGGGSYADETEFGFDNDACRGLIENGEQVLCRPVDYTTAYRNHTAAISWKHDNYELVFGMRNVLNDSPPLVDSGDGPFNVKNIPIGTGYDMQGRTAYLNFTIEL